MVLEVRPGCSCRRIFRRFGGRAFIDSAESCHFFVFAFIFSKRKNKVKLTGFVPYLYTPRSHGEVIVRDNRRDCIAVEWRLHEDEF